MEEERVGIWKQDEEGYSYTPQIPENQKLFNELMKRTPAFDPDTAWDYDTPLSDEEDNLDINAVFTDEEIIFMGNYDLPKFGAKFPNEAEEFMDELDNGY